jgi:hypothetical protein
MTRAEENRVRRLVHSFLHSDITAMEFREELNRITHRKKHKKSRRVASVTVGIPQTIVEDRAGVAQWEPSDTPSKCVLWSGTPPPYLVVPPKRSSP